MRNAAQPFTKSKLSVITHLNGHITKTTLIFFAALFLFIGCRKSDRQILEPQKENKDYTELKKKFFNSSSADPEVQKVAADIKKQDSIFKFLPDFVKKNGIPKWEKTLYKVQGKNSGRQSGSNARLSTDSSEVSQGMFLIPLQSASSSEIKSYITAYKHNDSLYSYRLYNRDSLNTLQPDSNQTKTNLLNTQAVFGYFEKTINSKDSITVSGPENGSLKNVNISFAPNNQGGRNSISARQADITCTIAVSIAITYEWRDFTLGDGAWVAVSVTVTIDISCTGGGSDGTSGGFGDPNSIGNYWWQYGSGWPWNNNNYSGFYVDPNAPWYPWWTGGGYYGGGSGFSPTVDYLTTALGLSWSQSLWLSQNPERASELQSYLQFSFNPQALQFSLAHLERMMTDMDYLSFIQQYSMAGTGQMWWENSTFLAPFGGISFGNWAINYLMQNPDVPYSTFENWFFRTPEYTGGEDQIDPGQITYDQPLTQVPLPSLSDVKANFPKLGTSGNYTQMPSPDVYQMAGGSLYQSHLNNPAQYSNACAVRGSRALLYSGIDIPVLKYGASGQRTQKGGDNKNYILDAVSFDRFMKDKFGDTPYKLEGADANDPQKVADFLKGKNGIYVILNNNPSATTGAGYSGHVDLILNGSCIGGAYTTPTGGVKSIRVWVLN